MWSECLEATHMSGKGWGSDQHTLSLVNKVSVQHWGDGPTVWRTTPAVRSQTSAVYFGHFGCLSILLFGRHHPSLPLPQALHLACAQLGQVLLLHVHTSELGTKGIVGNVLLLLGLKQYKTRALTTRHFTPGYTKETNATTTHLMRPPTTLFLLPD